MSAGACAVHVRGLVQGVGFRPFVYRLAHSHALSGWVRNGADGVELRLEGDREAIRRFLRELQSLAPPAAIVATVDVAWGAASGLRDFVIRESESGDLPSTRLSPDLAPCASCLAELFDAHDARHGYPYINCSDCGPRASIVQRLPYDRANTTMAGWSMDAYCRSEYSDPLNRRFHAQPVACPRCGPHYVLLHGHARIDGDHAAVAAAAALLREGRIVGVKGVGGYHLACDARDTSAVLTLRARKFRKEKPFALMVPTLTDARVVAQLSADHEALLESVARPIVLAPAREALAGVAPGLTEVGLMLPYTPLHHLLFAAGAPRVLVMTSANRSSEPIVIDDAEALERLGEIADAFLVGERPIGRRMEDSVARVASSGPVIVRRGRGYAPGAAAMLPTPRPILALGADLKSAVTLVVEGQAFVSQHLGDLEDAAAQHAFREALADLLAMYRVPRDQLVIAHDRHPEYVSTRLALEIAGNEARAIQHHRAHVASVQAERERWNERVLGIAFDGTGYGDDGTVWGGEFFVGSVSAGFDRVAHLRTASLLGGDAAARHPVQACAGYVADLVDRETLLAPPFSFPPRFLDAARLLDARVRSFATSSVGRLFDAAAALLGFTRPVTYEGQAAIWLEHLARGASSVDVYDCPTDGFEMDYRPLLQSVIRDRRRGRDVREIARAFQGGVARGTSELALTLCSAHRIATVVASGGVFQNALLVEELQQRLADRGCSLQINHVVPPNDGGISLGQAALAAFGCS
jgi:hydrogenase maturation protein HypF